MVQRKYDVVISGVAACLPECENVDQLEERILKGHNLVTDDDRKWPTREFNVPRHVGKIKNPFKFDQSFFGVHRKLCLVMDVHSKQSIERAYECICDAGLNPAELSGAKVAVLMSSMTSESEYGSVMVSKNSDHAMLGHSRCMQANRISYFFNFVGPSVAVDCSWVGGFQVLKMAQDLIASGQCIAAVVGATNLIFGPEGSVHYDGLKRLNYDGETKSYSANADGYSRSEGIVTFFLQRAEDAIRSYGTLVKVDCQGEMALDFTYPDYQDFEIFLDNFYSGLDINYDDIGYLEGDGCASMKVDAMELNAVDAVLCSKRTKPLTVGSIKSLIGHTESASCFASLVNALIALRTGFIPPTINYASDNPLVPSLRSGRIKVNTVKSALKGDYVGVTSFGVCSMYGHVLIKRSTEKTSVPLQIKESIEPYFPRLLIVSGRDEEIMKEIIRINKNKQPDSNTMYMVQNVFKSNHPQHLYRFYMAYGEGEAADCEIVPFQSGSERPVWFIFSGMGSQWPTMGKEMMKVPLLRNSIQICHDVLAPRGLNLIELITNPDPSVYDNILHSFVGIAAIQIALVDLLTEIGITPNGIVGHSVGELGCSYADGCLTREQTILAAYARGKASNDAVLIKGMMAAVGKGYSEIQNELPEGIEAACHNSSTSCTLSGPAEIVAKYVGELKERGIFARLVNVSNIAYHSKNIQPAAPFLLKYLKEIIPNPKQRSQRWISSSVPQSQWNTDLARYCSAEYHTNNLLSYVLFEEASSHIPKNAITIEIAPHGLLQAIIKKSLSSCINIPLTNRSKSDTIFFLHKALGKLYNAGLLLDLTKLHSHYEFPLSPSCGYIHPFITWEHSEDWIPISLELTVKTKESNIRWHNIRFTPIDDEYQHYRTNNIENSMGILPFSSFLKKIMDIIDIKHTELPVTFRNLKFHNKVAIKGELAVVDACILCQDGFGDFEVIATSDSGSLILSGQAVIAEKPWVPLPKKGTSFDESVYVFNQDQIFSYFYENGYSYSGDLKTIRSISMFTSGFRCTILWKNLIYFLDSVFKAIEFYNSVEQDEMYQIHSIGFMIINHKCLPEANEGIHVYYNRHRDELSSKLFVIRQIVVKPVKSNYYDCLRICHRDFVPYGELKFTFKNNFYNICAQIIDENMLGAKTKSCLTVVKFDNSTEDLALNMYKAFSSESSRMVQIKELTAKEVNTDSEMSLLRGIYPAFVYVIKDSLNEAKALEVCDNKDYPQFIMQWSIKNIVERPDNFAMIVNQDFGTYHLTLYKLLSTTTKIINYIVEPDSQLLAKIISEENDINNEKATVVVIRYRNMSDLINVIKKIHSMDPAVLTSTRRYIFLEYGVKFESTSKLFKDQINKLLLINILNGNSWGGIRYLDITSDVFFKDLHDPCVLLENIKSDDFTLKSIGLNSTDVVQTHVVDEKVGIVEYSGLQDGEFIFGLGRLTDEYTLERDPVLWWKKPSEWSVQQATSVPLFYTLAYYIIRLITKDENYRCDSLFVHAGFTPFGQAVINLGLSMKMEIFTTCYSQLQKKFLIEKFPLLDESNIFIIGPYHQDVFVNQIRSMRNDKGVDVVINPLDSPDFVLPTIKATAFLGRYYQVGKNSLVPAYSDRSFGLSIFEEELGIFGVNPENIWTLPLREKLALKKMIALDLVREKIAPLSFKNIDKNCSIKESMQTVIKEHQHEIPKKIQFSYEIHLDGAEQNLNLNGKKYLVIGGFNGLWYNLVVWLTLKGSKELYVVINEKNIPNYIKCRFKNFVNKHPASTIEFLPLSVIDSEQSCEAMIKKINKIHPIDAVIYISNGIESCLKDIDQTLRKNWPKCNLICVGSEDQVSEDRRADGFPGSSVILQRSNIRNKPLMAIFYKILLTSSESSCVISVKSQMKEGAVEDQKMESYLPENLVELISLCHNSSDEPSFVEVPTHSAPYNKLKGLNPLFVIPGFKVLKIKGLLQNISYPAFVATLPENIYSLDAVGAQLAKYLEDHFDLRIFTILAENWSGALALIVVRYLELLGKSVELLLIDAAPRNMKKWRSTAQTSNNILSKYCAANMSSIGIKELKNQTPKICEMIIRLEPGDWDPSVVQRGLDCLVNRLSLLESFSDTDLKLSCKIHLFKPSNSFGTELSGLDQICKVPVEVHIWDGNGYDSFFNSRRIISEINSLILLEYKTSATLQNVSEIGTLDLLLDAKFLTEGLTRT